MYHVLDVPFSSPFVNTLINSHEFVRIVTDFQRYMGEELQFITSNWPHPVAMLGDVQIKFPHVKSREEAAAQWQRRKGRLCMDRLFFMLNDNGLTEADLDILDACSQSNILVFTSQPHFGHRCVFQLPPFSNQRAVGNTMTRNIITGRVLIEQYFDFVGWLNQEKGSELESYRIRHRYDNGN